MFTFELSEEFKKVESGEIELDKFLEDVKKNRNSAQLVQLVRERLIDEKFASKRSIYCGIIHELNDRASLPLIWDLLEREETVGKRGSLVYAMENMNPISHLEKLIELTINDNYEVMTNCLNIIDNLEGHVEGEIIERCIEKIQYALKQSITSWRRETLMVLLNELEDE